MVDQKLAKGIWRSKVFSTVLVGIALSVFVFLVLGVIFIATLIFDASVGFDI